MQKIEESTKRGLLQWWRLDVVDANNPLLPSVHPGCLPGCLPHVNKQGRIINSLSSWILIKPVRCGHTHTHNHLMGRPGFAAFYWSLVTSRRRFYELVRRMLCPHLTRFVIVHLLRNDAITTPLRLFSSWWTFFFLSLFLKYFLWLL